MEVRKRSDTDEKEKEKESKRDSLLLWSGRESRETKLQRDVEQAKLVQQAKDKKERDKKEREEKEKKEREKKEREEKERKERKEREDEGDSAPSSSTLSRKIKKKGVKKKRVKVKGAAEEEDEVVDVRLAGYLRGEEYFVKLVKEACVSEEQERKLRQWESLRGLGLMTSQDGLLRVDDLEMELTLIIDRHLDSQRAVTASPTRHKRSMSDGSHLELSKFQAQRDGGQMSREPRKKGLLKTLGIGKSKIAQDESSSGSLPTLGIRKELNVAGEVKAVSSSPFLPVKTKHSISMVDREKEKEKEREKDREKERKRRSTMTGSSSVNVKEDSTEAFPGVVQHSMVSGPLSPMAVANTQQSSTAQSGEIDALKEELLYWKHMYYKVRC